MCNSEDEMAMQKILKQSMIYSCQLVHGYRAIVFPTKV